ncbi:organic solute transporter subunit alpha-like [Schistocerca cancellata]|uniref:organic solute transporter subunit alpha-like n=1 Tax=Schistocerca cancellata TaxID=274614 RepID=UPI002118916E|nr:organic solute transporter subunit alpha-like [Schistocerca cancellata]
MMLLVMSMLSTVQLPNMVFGSTVLRPHANFLEDGILLKMLYEVFWVESTKDGLQRCCQGTVLMLVKSQANLLVEVGAVIVFLSLLVPRADFLVEVVLQGTFVVCLYKFFCLLVAYGGGEEELTLKLRPAAFQPITGPCCCCPCCRLCCSPLEVSKSSLTRIRVLILQLPVVQWLIDLVLFVLLAEDQAVYQAVYQWVQVVPMVSLMVALWGANMFLSLLGDALAEHRVRSKFVAMQVVVALNAMLKAVSRPIAAALACYPPLTPALYCHMVVDMALLVINLAMAAWGRDLYRRDLPKIVLTSIRRLSADATTSPQTSPRHTRQAPAIVAA